MPDDGGGWGLIGGSAGGITAAAVLLGIYDRFFKRKDDREEAARKEEDALRASLSAAQTTLLDRLQREVERERTYREAAEKQREEAYRERDDAYREKDQAMDWASGWKALGDELWHIVKGHRTTINLYRVADGRPECSWPDETLPALQDILAHNAARRAR